ncbi:MAG TPA: hypothetical protein GXZ48_07445 [Acholeplasmataceae bacterium]|nr:hypothetical protein [Acholeplasmataceae bacterium]
MSNKDFETFIKTGNIKDYLKYKTSKTSGGNNEVKRRDNSKGDKISR